MDICLFLVQSEGPLVIPGKSNIFSQLGADEFSKRFAETYAASAKQQATGAAPHLQRCFS